MPRFYNTLTRSQEDFVPRRPGAVKMYTCGPTVYNYAHIGNFRAYIFEDLLRRYLEYRGYSVEHVMNLTDVEDKIIAKAMRDGISIFEVTAPVIEAFFKNLDDLNILRASRYPRATDHVPEMVAIVRNLVQKGHAYEKDGSYYFRIDSFPHYGCLAHLDDEGLKAGARGDADEYDKDNVRDFALWKAPKPGEHFWETELGPGRPGWHIECSAMSMKYLGNSFDIHCGGVDNIFPHHENEIAQSEAATGEKFVNYWLHCEHLIVDGQKMSKSLGNQYTLEDLIARGEDLRAIRYLLIGTHYRRRLNFSFDGLKAAAASLRRIDELILRLQEESFPAGESPEASEIIETSRNGFIAAMDDDLNISEALAALFTFVTAVNKLADAGSLRAGDAAAALALLRELDTVLGVMKFEAEELGDTEIEDLIRQRTEARARRDFTESDRIRDELDVRGIILQDTPEGVRWRRK